ncbi:DUF559 domain-containing protein [Nocardioides jensenii]|uniref:DUF559 domain-containing protein n=1 Tax=Nocardioides jensenii TaxID=1843 RepID=UPI00083234C0|nr:DUF559 domain-containing protein [Nocardioides jensenii]
MDPLYALQQLGGFADARVLRQCCRKRQLAEAVREGRIVTVGPGKYAVPGLEAAWREAHRLDGVVSGRSAAQFWDLSLKLVPGEVVMPVVTVPNKRKVARERREGVDLKWRDLPAEGVLAETLPAAPGARGRVTTLAQTVVDCCRDLPEMDALCVVDAALRRGVSPEQLLAASERSSRQVAPRVGRLIRRGDGRSANAFETCLRHTATQVDGLTVVPQVQIGRHRVDLADTALRIVIEAESYTWHGNKTMFRSDTRRYTELVIGDWMVLRFVWEDVVLKPGWVQAELTRAVGVRRGRLQAG